MKENFPIPLEFESASKNIFSKEFIDEKEFVAFCSLAVQLVEEHWNNRQGLAYHIAGAWLRYMNGTEDDLIEQIGSEFGTLELPDAHAGGSEEAVRRKWDKVTTLVKEAEAKYLQR